MYIKKYETWVRGDVKHYQHQWSVARDDLAEGVCIWCYRSPFDGELQGGIEHHSSKPIDHRSRNEGCWLLKGDCYHDGSSLRFDLELKPWLERIIDDLTPERHEMMFRACVRDMQTK